MEPVRREKVYRYGYQSRWFRIGTTLVVMSTALAIVAPGTRAIVGAAAGVLAIAALVWRRSQIGAHFSARGVKVVRGWRTIKIPWWDVRRFVVRGRPRSSLQRAAFVELMDGSLVWIEGIEAAPSSSIHGDDAIAIDMLVKEMNGKMERLQRRAVVS